MRVETAAEQLFFVTLFVTGHDGAGGAWTGTGFVYVVETTAGPAHFLVTNRHVLQDAIQLDLRFLTAGENGQPAYGQPHLVSISEVSEGAFWRGHPDARVDVAAFPLSHVLERAARGQQKPFFRAIGTEHLLTREQQAEFDALEEVTFMGYPSGLFDRQNLTPVARTGTTATPIAMDYEGEPAFLIDAAVVEGSSGSPVFVLSRGGYAARGGGFVVGDRFRCIGVLASGPARERVGEVFDAPADTRMVAVIRELMALGKVYKGWTVDETVDSFIQERGIERVRAPGDELEPVEMSEADEQISPGHGPGSN